MLRPLYFAYGSNLNLADWKDWCDQKGIDGSGLRPIEVAYLPDHELRFSHESLTRRGGALNVVPSLGRVVQGVLMEADGAAWKALDRKEGAPNCYKPQKMVVFDADGAPLEAIVYVLCPEHDKGYVEPSRKYTDIVEQGLTHFGLYPDDLHRAARNEPSNPFSKAFFVYGTWMRGESGFPVVCRHDVKAALLGRIPGRLIDLGDFPGLLPLEHNYDDWVQGDFIRVREIENALTQLDRIRGYCPESHYVRRLVQVHIGTRLRWAWTYQCTSTVKRDRTVVPSGCWRTLNGTKRAMFEAIVSDHVQHATLQGLLAKLRRLHPWDGGQPGFPKTARQLTDALVTGNIDERKLSQASGYWTARIATDLPLC